MTEQPFTETPQPVRRWRGLTLPTAGTYELDGAHKRVGFVAQHMMVSPVRGEFARATATIRVAEDPLESTVSATIDAASLTTQHDERDTHLRSPDFLDVETHPTLEFHSTGIRPKAAEIDDSIFAWARLRGRGPAPAVTAAASSFVVDGVLTVRGVSHAIELELTFGGARRDPYGRDIVGFHATAEIDREDFGLVWNVVLETGGWLVGKRVRIEIAGEAIRSPDA